MGILEDILARLERIEAAVGSVPAPGAQTPAPEQPAAVPGPPQTTGILYAAQAAVPGQQATAVPGQQATAVPGQQATVVPGQQAAAAPVPSFEELTERLMQVSERYGPEKCVDLVRTYGGGTPDGSVSIRNVPPEQYAALHLAAARQLGVH